MATQQYRIVSAEDSELRGEPHIEGGRITVRDVYGHVEQRGLAPDRVAEPRYCGHLRGARVLSQQSRGDATG